MTRTSPTTQTPPESPLEEIARRELASLAAVLTDPPPAAHQVKPATVARLQALRSEFAEDPAGIDLVIDLAGRLATTATTPPPPAPGDGPNPATAPLTPASAWSIVQGLVLALDARADAIEERITPSIGLIEHLRIISAALVAITEHIGNTHLYGEDADE